MSGHLAVVENPLRHAEIAIAQGFRHGRIQRVDYPAVIVGKQQYAGAAELILNMPRGDSGGIRYGTAGRQFFTQRVKDIGAPFPMRGNLRLGTHIAGQMADDQRHQQHNDERD